jgi:hypothetical protein
MMPNFLSEGLGGAATGAALGSFIPGIGTGIGALGGGALGLLSGLFNKPQKPQPLNPQQQNLQNQSIQQIMNLLKGGQPTGFQPIANRAQQRFQNQTIPSLAERFSALGAQNSSAFQGALGNAGADLQSQLAALESRYGQNQLQQLLNPALASLDVTREGPGFFETAGQGSLSLLPLLLYLQNQSGQPINPAQQTQPGSIVPTVSNPTSQSIQPTQPFRGLFSSLGATNPTQQFGFPGSTSLGQFGFPGNNYFGNQDILHSLGGKV